MPHPPIREHVQSLDLGEDITLYEIDLTQWNQGYVRLYLGDEGAQSVSFDGNVYSPWPLKTSGWKQGGTTLPRPLWGVANVNRVFTPFVQSCDGFRRAPFKRIQTYAVYLDFLADGTTPNPDADGNQHEPIDYYEVNRISLEGEIEGVEVIQWELRTPIDRPNSKIPRIVLIRENCQHTYRTYNAATDSFNYEKVSCPYAGTDYFDVEGNVVTAKSEDRCGFFLRNCKDRFGQNAVLPFLAFPGLERVRLR